MPSPEKSAATQRFIEFLSRKHLRLTSQRKAIIRTVFNTDQHFTAERLLEWSRRADPSVSRATVYRTLQLLTESGLVREMDFSREHRYYDPNYADHPNHSHIICVDCDKIFEFESGRIDQLESEISHRMGFELAAQRLQLTGKCEELKRLGICKNKEE